MGRVYRKILIGLGLDSKDGHTRLTKGENYKLLGGSKETHEVMQEKAVKFNEQLDKRRKTLDDLDESEFCEIAERVGLNLRSKKKK